MAISFNETPANLRVPFVAVEFDSSNAQQGLGQLPYKALLLGQRRSAGTVAELTPTRITSAAQAGAYFGAGSVLHNMAEAWFEANQFTETWAVAIDDDSEDTAATGSVALTGPATAAGALAVYIAGRRIEVGVAAGAANTTVGTALAAAITANTSLPVTATHSNGTVSLTAKHKGVVGNGIDVRVNYAAGEATPAGLGVTITAMSSGAGNPDLSGIWAVIEDDQFNVVAMPYIDSTSLGDVEDELADRWGPMRQQEGNCFVASAADFATVSSLGDGRNSPFMTIVGSYGSPTPIWEWAAVAAGVAAQYGNIDPARPFQTLPMPWVKAPAKAARFTLTERNLLLYDGISTFTVDADGQVRVERLITTYKTNALGAPDTAYLDVNTPLTLGYLRATFRNRLRLRYPRHKLADDGTRYGPGQAVVTPKVIKAECVALFREWEELALVEDAEQFKNGLIVERNGNDPNRLDIYLPPDLVNQLRVTATKIGFLL